MPSLATFTQSHFTDFGAEPLGPARDWPQGQGDFAAEIAAAPGSIGGRKLAMPAFSVSGTRLWRRVPEAADIEVCAVVELPAADPLPGHTSYARTALRVSPDGAAYYLLSYDKGNARLKLERGALPERDRLIATAPKAPFAPGSAVALRFRAEGPLLRARMWTWGHAEPRAWEIEARDDAIAAGGVGYRKSHADGADAYWWYAAGLDGAPAPSPTGRDVAWTA